MGIKLELLFSKKYSTLGIMERLAAKWKQTLALKSNNKTEGRSTREGASSLVSYICQDADDKMKNKIKNLLGPID